MNSGRKDTKYKIPNTIYSFILPFLAFVLPLGLYIKTLSPTYIPIDAAEFALCAHYWGICHPPGFPLYTVVAHFFVQIFPVGSLIFKVNLLSAIFGAGTILLVYLTLAELKVKGPIAFATAMIFAVSAVFWEFSIAADVFTFGTFLIALTFYLVFSGRILLAFFALGLSASHFYITAVLSPLILWYFVGFKFQIRQVLLSAISFGLGFFPQGLMYWRMQADPAVNWGHARGIDGFWYFLRRQEFGSIFLLANPVLTYTLEKTIKQFKAYFASLFAGFGIVLPLFAFLIVPLKADRKVVLLISCFILLVFVQLFLLSTIDPTGEDNPFQLNKFYLSSFIIMIILAGIAVDFFTERFLGGEVLYALLVLGFITLLYITANFKHNDYSKNYFSQNMVEDSLNQLPKGAVAVTVSHIMYFGGRYEQEVNGKYPDITLLYFPNEKNRDNEFYHKEIFANDVNQRFINTVSRGKNMGEAEKYVLSMISRNLNRDIYILQGTFEEGFFRFLKPYIVPYGMWWRLTPDLARREALAGDESLMQGLKNGEVAYDDLELKQQQLDALNYAVSYHSLGIHLASLARYDEAKSYLNKSLSVNPKKGGNIESEIELIDKTRLLESRRQELIDSKNEEKLAELGNNYFTLLNYQDCVATFLVLVGINDKNAQYFNNLAACQASRGQTNEARENYQRALSIDPNMELAKAGLEVLGD